MAVVAQYEFSESLVDSAGTNNGTGVGTPTYGPSLLSSEPSGKALSLNGSSQYVKVPNAAPLQITGSYWHTVWVSFSSLEKGQMIFEKGTEDWFLYKFSGASGGLLAGHRDSGGTPRETNVATTELVPGRAYRIDVVYNGATLKVYINGVEAASTAVTSGPRSSTGELRIGAEHSTTEFLGGSIDKLVLRNAAGTAAEITAQWREQTPTIFSDDFSLGSKARWYSEDAEGEGSITFVKSVPTPPVGEYAMLVKAKASAKRRELAPGRIFLTEGDDVYIDYWQWMGTAPQAGKSWHVLGQLHEKGTTFSPPLANELLSTGWFLYGGPEGSTKIFEGPLPTVETWRRVTIRVKHSTTEATGLVELWIDQVKQTLANGQKTMNLKTLQDEWNYPKIGIYQDPTTSVEQTAAFAGYSIGRSLPFAEAAAHALALLGVGA